MLLECMSGCRPRSWQVLARVACVVVGCSHHQPLRSAHLPSPPLLNGVPPSLFLHGSPLSSLCIDPLSPVWRPLSNRHPLSVVDPGGSGPRASLPLAVALSHRLPLSVSDPGSGVHFPASDLLHQQWPRGSAAWIRHGSGSNGHVA